jgi:hypothetical protein
MEHAKHHSTGWQMPAKQARDERFKIATEMLALNMKEIALLPTQQQEQVRLAMQALLKVQEWCKRQTP